MKDLDQFIDEALFKESDQYKLIYEQVKQTIEEPKKTCRVVLNPTNFGTAAEYTLALAFIDVFTEKNMSIEKEEEKYNIPELKYNGRSVSKDCIRNSINEYVYSEQKRREIDTESKETVQNKIDDIAFKNNIDPRKIKFIDLVGKSDRVKKPEGYFFETSADIFLYSDSLSGKGISVKRGSQSVYRLGQVQSKLNDKIIGPELFKAEGGGIKKLYDLYNLKEISDIENKTDIEVWNLVVPDFCNKANKVFISQQNIKPYFEIIKNIITRADEKVFLLTDISKKGNGTIYPQLLDQFLNHIVSVWHIPVLDEYLRIGSQITKTKPFIIDQIREESLTDEEKKSVEKLISGTRIQTTKLFEDFINDIKTVKTNEIPKELKIFITDYNSAVKEFSKQINSVLESITSNIQDGKITRNKGVFSFKLEERDGKYDVRGEIREGLIRVSNLNKIFSYIENEPKFKKLKEVFVKLLENSEKIFDIYTQPKQKIKESLFESLIIEALDEKEYQKLMKKIMSSGAKGLISAIPSNKTNNSIAVRFDSEDNIDAGIKKIKSSLRSAGYQLDDKRVLKFDQDRDTTDVIKNGQVVGRLFYRVDVKERKGLAYEHILGAVLTGKITDQLKNRIDLGPDASKEDVMSKLNSEEFKPLFDSAKKAAPLIKQKVGKVARAESVGSTNNKADFVLTTHDGKTVGLSAKYAAGEKDNEYKMNKVLGFGTEEDSLVYNPKMVPWWVVGRKLFLEKLKKNTGSFSGREYDPDYEDLDAPAWMKTAKESNPDVYKETMEELYAHIRNILTRNLRRMKISDLTAFVMEADLGKEEERENYDMFIKVVDGPSGLSVTDINIDHEDTTNMGRLNPEEIVVQDRSDIIIKLPGFDELKINSIKFKSDMLSSKAGDLKIKTR